jgi:hypothetical protein
MNLFNIHKMSYEPADNHKRIHMNKTILTDADGVLFDWVGSYVNWATTVKGLELAQDYLKSYTLEGWFGITKDHAWSLVTEFNGGNAMAVMEPYLDAVEYVNKLHYDHGYKFIVITSMGLNPYAKKLRWSNLKQLFGDAIQDLIVTDILVCKGPILETYEPAIWIEDKPSNANVGAEHGHRSFLLNHDHNAEHELDPRVTRVDDWNGIYDQIINL